VTVFIEGTVNMVTKSRWKK